ncbi:MAG: metal-dependent hydrolase [Candidatus Solibacter usitatus]|nr:metal-dependent hydrolase [Candidatus Solibacter usitatus]
MDNLTHSLTAVLLSRAGLNRLAPHAGWLAVAAANVPDLDIVSGSTGALDYLAVHRGFTHALLFFPLAALVPLPLWWLLARKLKPTRRQWLGAYAVSLAAAASHLALDFLNVYAIRLLLPFSSRWLHLDLVHIIDVWIWALLLVCALGPLLARLVYSEIGARPGSGRGMAATGLLLLCLYLGGRAWLHDQALATLESRLYQHEAPLRVLALPSPANPWSWTGVVETPRSWRVLPVNLLGDFDPEAGQSWYKPDSAPIDAAVRRSATGRVFLDFSQAPLWRLTPASTPEGGLRVRVYDLRFGLPGRGAFGMEAILDSSGKVVRQRFRFGDMEDGER